jgi:dihydrolipoamide dehydrogenase
MDEYDLVVVGAGPGGYVAALRAGQLGLRVACVERESELGGTCLRIGCIPSKALLESTEQLQHARTVLPALGIRLESVEPDLTRMMARKDEIVGSLTRGVAQLFANSRITRIIGDAVLLGDGGVEVSSGQSRQVLRARHIILATGSSPASLPGIDLDGRVVGTSTAALGYESVPKHLVVIGAGVIGLELGSVWRRLGAAVTVVEYSERILPGLDLDLATEALRHFRKSGMDFWLGRQVIGAKAVGEGAVVRLLDGSAIECDRVLVAVGRRPNSNGLGLEAAGVNVDAKGFIRVDGSYSTSAAGIYAVGDVIGGPMLAHKAEDEGVACVEALVGGVGHVNYAAIPSVVYTDPEIAMVGKGADQLEAEGIPHRVGTFPFQANGRARALGTTIGRVKLVAHSETDRLLGAQILGARAGELIAELTAAIEFGASAEDVARTCHAHPTLSECVREAALAVGGRALHI